MFLAWSLNLAMKYKFDDGYYVSTPTIYSWTGPGGHKYKFQPYDGSVFIDGDLVSLTRTESYFLERICMAYPVAMRHDSEGNYPDEYIKVYVSRVRAKTKSSIIRTVHGFGYYINCERINKEPA